MSQSMETIVKTDAGKVEGYPNRGLYVFKGIPYAAPPVGERRWLPPETAEPWSGVRPVFSCHFTSAYSSRGYAGPGSYRATAERGLPVSQYMDAGAR